jgi:hypothetical protein
LAPISSHFSANRAIEVRLGGKDEFKKELDMGKVL